MKKFSFISVLVLAFALYFSTNAVAQENPFVVLEYMHVKPDNYADYTQVENFWRHILVSSANSITSIFCFLEPYSPAEVA